MNTINEQIAILQAYKEGKTIQVHQGETKDGKPLWIHCANKCYDENEIACFNFQEQTYRVKPGSNLRPYKSAEEFLKAQKEHGPWIDETPAQLGSEYCCPIWLTNKSVGFTHRTYSFSEIIKFTWQDGTPCGIEEE